MPRLRLLIPALAAALLAACAPSADPAADTAVRRYGRLAFQPCTLASEYAPSGIEAQCARLRVPENPNARSGRTIALNIAWLPVTNEGAATADPVFFLAGGPGQAATDAWPLLDAAFAEVRKNRHVILVDQRGTGRSHALTCRNAEGENAFTEDETESADDAAALQAAAAFAARCAASLDADPRFYTTSDAVRDLDTVRAALGAERINLVGGSYGTRVAQQYAMRHPDRVRTLVLDGLVPNELVLGSEHARNLDAALALQFARCKELSACRARFGEDLRAQLRTLMQRLEAQPVEVDYRHPETGAPTRGRATAGTVAALTRMFAYWPEAASLLPLILHEADRGRYEPLMATATLVTGQVGEQITHGMQLSVICAEDADRLRDDPADLDTVLGTQLSRVLLAQCKVWPTGTRPADFHAPLKSQAPALLLSGEFDPVTPPRYGEQVLKGLPNGRHLVLRGRGHGSFAVGCVPKLLAQFLERADARALDAGCLDTLRYVPPFTSFNGWEP
ncbi:MAG TPA: alpha/beta hydrolase [Lysobacter sp.]|nr:alpha/beta hydrolase [Lysobacter sp.]